MDNQLENYIKKNLAKGVPKEDIKNSLLSSGWKALDIDIVIDQLESLSRISYKQKPHTQIKITSKETSDSSSTNKFKLSFIILLIIIITGALVFVGLKINLFSSNKVKRSSDVPIEIHNDYLTVWKQLFIKNNQITQVYFDNHIFPKETDLTKQGQFGEHFIVKYEFRIDWVSIKFQDVVVIKPNEADHYLSLEEIEDLAGRGKITGIDFAGGKSFSEAFEESMYYQIHEIIVVDSIISKKAAKEKLASCNEKIKPGNQPYIIDDFFSFESHNKTNKRLLYQGAYRLENKNYLLAQVDLVSGEINCIEGPSLQSEVEFPF